MSQVSTRLLMPLDWPRLWPLLKGMGGQDSEDLAHSTFLDLLKDDRWLLLAADVDGILVGYAAAQDFGPRLRASVSGRVARLHDLFVDPGLRRTGVGRALMHGVTTWAGNRVSYLQWQAHETSAAPFYERIGHRGSPCPQPDFPEFEIDFRQAGGA